MTEKIKEYEKLLNKTDGILTTIKMYLQNHDEKMAIYCIDDLQKEIQEAKKNKEVF